MRIFQINEACSRRNAETETGRAKPPGDGNPRPKHFEALPVVSSLRGRLFILEYVRIPFCFFSSVIEYAVRMHRSSRTENHQGGAFHVGKSCARRRIVVAELKFSG